MIDRTALLNATVHVRRRKSQRKILHLWRRRAAQHQFYSHGFVELQRLNYHSDVDRS